MQEAGDPRHVGEILLERGLVTSQQIKEALETQRDVRAAAKSEGSIRVDVTLLDILMNLAGELVLARNQILQFTSAYGDRGFHNSCARLNLITTELQERVMQTRMQPIGKVWTKFPRVIRRLASVCNKDVRVEMDGRDTELDKTILEAVKDPLTHFIRNSVDHGIESPGDREAAGKPRRGTVTLRAVQEGGQVLLEVSDDGRGISVDRVRSKALEKGVVSPVDAARMTEQDILELIFLPGFSTADSVTNVSGRGVGMDVVKTNIERVGGVVSVHSQPGRGTTFRIKIPLTLAIIPALLVSSGGCRYALPQMSLLELVQFEPEEATRRIEYIEGRPFYRLRGRLLPLVYLNRELHLEPDETSTVNIVVLQAADRDFGLVVDHINDTAEIVVKPLARQLKRLDAFAGATILGDGTVALILDVLGLAPQPGGEQGEVGRRIGSTGANGRSANAERLLLFDVGGGHRMAARLSSIARLEELPADKTETSHGREVIQYRGAILPLFRLSELLHGGGPSDPDRESLAVLVHDTEAGAVGLVVDEILDIIDEEPKVQSTEGSPWLLGSAILQGQVADVLDIERLVEDQGLLWLARPKSRLSA